MSEVGGLTKEKPADDKVQKICDQVKTQLERQLHQKFDVYKAESYKTQLVAGTNYFIKVHLGREHHVHLRVYENLPCNGGEIELSSIQKQQTHHSPIEYFD